MKSISIFGLDLVIPEEDEKVDLESKIEDFKDNINNEPEPEIDDIAHPIDTDGHILTVPQTKLSAQRASKLF